MIDGLIPITDEQAKLGQEILKTLRGVGSFVGKQGLSVDAKEQHSSRARGETAAIQRGGGRFVTLACGSLVFHNVADRWPEAVDVSLLARYSTALAHGAHRLVGCLSAVT